MEEKYFFVQNGKQKIKCRALFDCYSEDYDRNYIMYTDDKKDKSGNINVFASAYTIQNGELCLEEIESDEEFATLIQAFKDMNRE